ncbi:Tex family protein [Clostridium sp. MD294]|uniref:Tex family protein n=1 Tax=Clostridium sp. MD294 TaxID=97138 RepID=UPI0002CA6E08|nr:Tex family protein [Clostridium sp. MD294]NDO46558.1 RNA-binding transcriptional accessory protein [Clostridium sp. MD294]USF29011.1 Protein YhgF [Clostridium sp. MD294]
MDIQLKLQQEFELKQTQVENVIKLIDEGNTIPFIARYRKEMTGSLDDQVLRSLSERLYYLRNLEEKRQQVKNIITEQGNMTEELEQKLSLAETMTEIEDIYRPFRPKRRTRATIAKEKGLEPLADLIWLQIVPDSIENMAKEFIDAEKGVETIEDALSGAKDIIAERISDDADLRKMLRTETVKNGFLTAKASDETAQSVYEMYYDFKEPIKKVAGHRVLAINRGEKEDFLTVKIALEDENVLLQKLAYKIIIKNSNTREILQEVIADSYKRLISPSLEREIRNDMTEQAEENAIKVFRENLKQLLLQPPIKDKVVLALDPAFRTGCKIAVIDQTGKTLDTAVVYPTAPQKKTEEAKNKLKDMIEKYHVDVIAIGNGTASRESEIFVAETLLKAIDRAVFYVIVNEAGASVYSASKLGAEEFPEFDVALRSAVSIGRRLQDPLAELVKIDPKSIGVGQYQHDMNQKRLGEALGGVVESCVNAVGVDLNTASPSLLSYVAGVSNAVAKNILKYREENGKFKTRKELLKVPKLGPKAFEQCAGFLRIPESETVLDNTGVHPESYKAAEALLKTIGYTLEDVQKKNVKNISQKIFSKEKTAEELGIGVPTLEDIIKELEKPGRDPREEMPLPVLRSDVLSMEDLKTDMVLKGTVRNVIDFGVFVDIGVHQDGLVHISELSEKYIKHPLEAVSVGDIVQVKVLNVDMAKKRISLTMKNIQQ